ncbi:MULTISPECIES: HD domain-containing protein [unclassified Saccharicrinis]|uniref:HD domain-containing protein n=1 Tax=unclassified Saccharicrinis TaxID=2646859 RepID=UPI003D32CE53
MENWIKHARLNFDIYYSSFNILSEDQKRNFKIKHEHSYRVSEICGQLADKLKLDPNSRNLAVTIGLFHDIGRFKQLVEFNTFNDAVSVDHAKYSVEVLQEDKFLEGFEEAEKLLVAIRHHNKLKLPEDLSGENLFFAQLIRDADKLDILKVITDYYTTCENERNHTLTWEMPEGENVSDRVLDQILAKEQIARENLRNQVDIKVMQLSWVFDFNFKPSLQILQEKGYLEMIYNTMPQNETTSQIYMKVRDYLKNPFPELMQTHFGLQ